MLLVESFKFFVALAVFVGLFDSFHTHFIDCQFVFFNFFSVIQHHLPQLRHIKFFLQYFIVHSLKLLLKTRDKDTAKNQSCQDFFEIFLGIDNQLLVCYYSKYFYNFL